MKKTVLDIMLDILKLDQEQLLSRFNDKEVWDSMLRVEILFAIEDEFDIQFAEEELVELNTPEKLYEAVLRKAEKA